MTDKREREREIKSISYSNEKDGQIAFFENYKHCIASIKDKEIDDILLLYTDGVINGNILEFKTTIADINKVLFQTIKYLSKCRIMGIPIPANILLISLNNRKIYKFNSQDFLPQIEEVYIGASSKNNDGFNTTIKPEEINYATDSGSARLIEILRQENYTKININEDCIVGWAEKYYKINPSHKKEGFLGGKNRQQDKGEIRHPWFFKEYINPYNENDDIKFKYLMDKLNSKLEQREKGAFYTPVPYCQKAAELIIEAIKLVPKGNNYIILDRCAGTGNLEEVLVEKMCDEFGKEEGLKIAKDTIIVSTYDYYEYLVLSKRIGSVVKMVIPPEENAKYNQGNLLNADALSKEYIENEYLQGFINNPKCTIILLENPPYRDVTTGRETDVAQTNRTSYVKEQMRGEFGTASNDIANQFIYSAFKYYLRQPTDSYIVFSPVKYFKSIGLVNKKFNNGYLLNRRHFHAGASAISLIWWQNIEKPQEEFILPAYDIELAEIQDTIQERTNKGKLKYEKDVVVKKVYKIFSSEYYDKRKFSDDLKNSIFCQKDGYEQHNKNCRVTSIYNLQIIGYLIAQSFLFATENVNLLRQIQYNGNGFYLRSDNYLEKLPLFCAKLYPQANWYEKDVYFTTADGGFKYLQDEEFVKACFIFTCLSQSNKCISFVGSDGRYYRNELCFDSETLASQHLTTLQLNQDDQALYSLWQEVLTEAKTTKEYQENIKYGTYQIIQELNTSEKNEKDKTTYHYPMLNTKINALKQELKNYYAKHIQNKLFEYELLK
jgi:hypothetical protein